MGVNMEYGGYMTTKTKQCAMCKDYYDYSMLVGILDTYMCDVCALELNKLLEEEMGSDYKQGLPKTTSHQVINNIPVFKISSPIHPAIAPDPITA